MPPSWDSDSPTARPAALEALRYQAILDTARDAIISIDRHGRITDFNQAAVAMFGYTAREVVGRDVSTLMPVPYRDEHADYLHAYQQTGHRKAIGRIREVEARRKNGETFPIELSVSEARVGEELLYTAIIRDVNELRRAHAEVRRLEAEAQERVRFADIGAITTRLVHDLGNPLSGISMQAELLKRKIGREEPHAGLTQPIERVLVGVARLRDLVRGFTDFAREQRLELTSIDLRAFLRDLTDHWQPVAAARAVRMHAETGDAPPSLSGDEPKLRRVFDNLLKNAIEAIDEPGGEVRIEAHRAEDDRVRIEIADTGSGIPSGVEVFRLFETTKPLGTGIGLPVSKEIVAAHGGVIAFLPNVPRGTVFTVELPLMGPEPL